MKTAALFLYLIFSYSVFSQYYPDSNSYCQLVPYYDYEFCAKGIKDSNGIVIVEPRYSEIVLLPGDLLLVCENELYGVLDCALEVVIPMEYKHLEWHPKYHYAAIHGENYLWIFETDTGKGLMNSSLEVIIPPENELIGQVSWENQTYLQERWVEGIFEKTLSYFWAEKNGKLAVYHESGKIIVPQQFDEITCHAVNTPAATPKLPEGIFFRAKNDSIQFLFSKKGEQLFEESVNKQLYVYSVDSSTIVKTTFWDGITTQAFCLETGLNLPERMREIYKEGNHLIAMNQDGSFEVYGRNLTPIYQGVDLKGPPTSLYVNNNAILSIYSGNQQAILLSQNGEVLIQSKGEVFVTNSETEEFIWTAAIHPNGEDTLRIHYPDGSLKTKYVLSEIHSLQSFKKPRWDDFNEESTPLLFVRKGKKWGALDRNGDLVIPFKLDQAGNPFREAESIFGEIVGYYVVQSGKMGIVDRTSNYVYPCKYDTIFSSSISMQHFNYRFFRAEDRPEVFSTDGSSLCNFAIRNKRLYTIVKEKERRCDSTLIPFQGDLQLVGQVLINKEGKVIRTIKKGSIHAAPKFYLYINGDEAQVILLSGENGLNIQHFKSAQVEGDYLKIKLNDETMGVVSLDGKHWLYSPKYYDVTFTNFPPNHAWVKESPIETVEDRGITRVKTYSGRWKLVDSSYNEVVEFPFSFPVDLSRYPQTIFESEGKIGMMNASMHIIFPPRHEFIIPVYQSNFALLFNRGKWQLGHSSGDVLDGDFHSISSFETNKTMTLFSYTEKDTLIGFVHYDNGFKWLIPMTEMHTLINSGQIKKALHSVDTTESLLKGIPDTLNRWRVQNNELILSFILRSQCQYYRPMQRSVFFTPDFEFYDPRSNTENQQFYHAVNTFGYASNAIGAQFNFPEGIHVNKTPVANLKQLKVTHHSSELLTIAEPNPSYPNVADKYHNYIFVDSAQSVELSDLLVKDVRTSVFLREAVTQKLNAAQLGYEACPDLDRIEASMWSMFCFQKGGLQLASSSLYSFTYDELYPYFTELGKQLTPW